MKIGELAKQAGVPASTIRYYEQRGVLAKPRRTAAGYREYGEDATQRLHLIRLGQALGFNLDVIPELIDGNGKWDHDKLLEQITQRQAQTTELIKKLESQLKALATLRTTLTETWAKQECVDVTAVASLVDSITPNH